MEFLVLSFIAKEGSGREILFPLCYLFWQLIFFSPSLIML
jgi:hypothetical protein